jgi:DnaK suppressor protein
MPERVTPEQVEELREELVRERARLERTMKSTAEGSRPVEADQSTMGRLARMDALQQQSLTADLHSREQARHAQIEDALERIEHGSYGFCSTCSHPIPYGRLLVFPEARTCATCGARI